MLHNLLDNAVRYGGPDSSIEVRPVHEDRYGLVLLADRSDGIPEGEGVC